MITHKTIYHTQKDKTFTYTSSDCPWCYTCRFVSGTPPLAAAPQGCLAGLVVVREVPVVVLYEVRRELQQVEQEAGPSSCPEKNYCQRFALFGGLYLDHQYGYCQFKHVKLKFKFWAVSKKPDLKREPLPVRVPVDSNDNGMKILI